MPGDGIKLMSASNRPAQVGEDSDQGILHFRLYRPPEHIGALAQITTGNEVLGGATGETVGSGNV